MRVELATQEARALAHTEHAQVLAAGWRGGAEADAVVAHLEADLVGGALQSDLDGFRSGVPNGVGEGFLGDTEQRGFDGGWQATGAFVEADHGELGLEAGA